MPGAVRTTGVDRMCACVHAEHVTLVITSANKKCTHYTHTTNVLLPVYHHHIISKVTTLLLLQHTNDARTVKKMYGKG